MAKKTIYLFLLLFLGNSNLNAGLLEEYKAQIVSLERSYETENLIRNFPFLQILDDYLDYTSGIRFYTVGDKRTGDVYDTYKTNWTNPEEWNFRQQDENGKYWFWTTNTPKWTWKDKDYKEKVIKND